MTTAWIDIRGCKRDEISDIISAAAEHRIEPVGQMALLPLPRHS